MATASYSIGGFTDTAENLRKKFTDVGFGDRKKRQRFADALTFSESSGKYGSAFDDAHRRQFRPDPVVTTNTTDSSTVQTTPIKTADDIRREQEEEANRQLAIRESAIRAERERARLEQEAAMRERDAQQAALQAQKDSTAQALSRADVNAPGQMLQEQAAGVTTQAAAPTQNMRATNANQTEFQMKLLEAMKGFSDDAIRRRQQETVNQLIRQSEQSGRDAAMSLRQPVFRQDALSQTLQRNFLRDLLSDPTGDDAISTAQRAQYDADVAKRRDQLTEDLQRFGVLGGDGVSAGAVADILGEFESGAARGGLDIGANRQARRQANLENAILPFQQQQNDLRQRQQEFGFSANQARIQAQQDVADRTLARLLTSTDVTEREQFEEATRARLGDEKRADRSLGLQEDELFGANRFGRQTLGGRQLQQQVGLERDRLGLERDRLGQQGNQFDQQIAQQRAEMFTNERLRLQELGLSQQEIDNQMNQFQQSLGEQRAQRYQDERLFQDQLGLDRDIFDRESNQFDRSLAEQRAQRYQDERLEQGRLGQQDRQFLASLGLDERRLTEQGRQFDAQNRLSEAELLGALDGQATLADRQLGFNYAQLGQQDRQFLKSLGLDERRLDEMSRQFDASNALAEGNLLGRYNGQDTLARDQVDLQNSQFLQDLGFRNRSLNIQDENADRDRNQRGSMFQQELQQSDRQFLAQLGLSERQIDLLEEQQQQQAEQDRIAQIIKAAEAEIPGFGGNSISLLLQELIGTSETDRIANVEGEADRLLGIYLSVGDRTSAQRVADQAGINLDEWIAANQGNY